MVKINFKRKKKSVLLVAFAIMFCLLSALCFPVDFASAESQNDDYYAFDRALSQMYAKYGNLNDIQTFDLSDGDYKVEDNEVLLSADIVETSGLVVDNNEEFYALDTLKTANSFSLLVDEQSVELETYASSNRLIVISDENLSSYGAVAVAEYQNYHFFQYTSEENADKAFEYYSNLKEVDSVFYDTIIYSDDVSENSWFDISSTSSRDYNSWGDVWMGWADYTNTMLEMYDEEDLPEVIVAVFDSGIYAGHNLFRNRIVTEYATSFITEESSVDYEYEDLNGHGTHVSGTIAEATLSNVKILPIKILDETGHGELGYIIQGLAYVANIMQENPDLNIKAINMSVGVTNGSSGEPELDMAIENIKGEGVASVVSAGNGDRKTQIRIDASNACPANVEEAITVTALRRNISFPSGYTLSYDTYSNYGECIDFCAPGSSITSAGLGYPSSTSVRSGTSMAAPHVTACVALLYSNPQFKNYSVDQIYSLLKEHAVDLGEKGFDIDYGWGMVYIGDIGLTTEGSVLFSEQNKIHTSAFQLTLSYDYSGEDGEVVRIYYSTDPYADSVDSQSTLYTGSLSITETTKVTAVAYVYDANGVMLQRSSTSTLTYYFDNEDVLSNYDYYTYGLGAIITQYNGKDLTTLNVPQQIGLYTVIGIDSNAFANSTLEVVNLPSSLQEINSSAFYGVTTLKEVHCTSGNLTIGQEAFRGCTNLCDFDVLGVSSVGVRAFADCSSLTSINLPYVTNVDENAFARSALQTLFVGQGLDSFARQVDCQITHIYGYDGEAQTYATSNNIEFTNLTLSITKNFGQRIIISENSSTTLQLSFKGYGVSYNTSFTGSYQNIAVSQEAISQFEGNLNITLSNLTTGRYTLSVTLTDAFSNSLKSTTISIEVVAQDADVYAVNFAEGHFDVYVDGNKIQAGDRFFAGYQYEIQIMPESGYLLQSIVINSQNFAVNQEIYLVIDNDVTIIVETMQEDMLSVTFNTSGHGDVVIENNTVTSAEISRNESLAFSISPDEGYKILRVEANGQLLAADDNGVYHVENITTNVVIDIIFEQAYYSMTISYGKGGSVSSTGGSVDSVAHGSSRTFFISPTDGYEVDFVSVNGREVAVNGNRFTIDNISDNCDIVVSFREATSSSQNSTVLAYFLILLGIFVVFIVARVVLYYVRKEKNK